MLLGNKKSQDQDQEKNWCIVLNPVTSLMDRRRLAQKLSEIFSLSAEEASDLIQSTPIILLDHLTRPMAFKLKEYFGSFGADVTLSKDTLFKRKCYRAVWPQSPTLSFLHGWEDKDSSSKFSSPLVEEALHPEDALQELQTLNEKVTLEKKHLQTQGPDLADPFLHQQSVWKDPKNTWPWRLSQAEVESAQKPQPHKLSQEEGRSGEFSRMQIALKNLEAKQGVLIEEYKQARIVYEEKLSLSRKEQEQARNRLDEMNARYQSLQKELQKGEEGLREKERVCLRLSEERNNAQEECREEKKLRSQADENSKFKIQELEAKFRHMETLRSQMQTTLGDYENQISSLRERSQSLEIQLEDTSKKTYQEKTLREQMEIKQKELEKLKDEAEEGRKRDFSDKESRFREVDTRFQQTDKMLEKQHEILEEIVKRLNGFQEMLLSSSRTPVAPQVTSFESRRQVEEISGALREEEKRKWAAKLHEKEVLLKRLVKDQERTEKEICDREESVRRLITEQENLEKEILEVRHAQRQWPDPSRF